MARKNSSSTVDNAELEHTEGGATTRDAMDAGVPMTPGSPAEPIGPEDALGPGPKRGDYSDRLDSGPAMVTRINPNADIDKDEPRFILERADAQVANVGDAPGKGGVSTAEALEAHAVEVSEAGGRTEDSASPSDAA